MITKLARTFVRRFAQFLPRRLSSFLIGQAVGVGCAMAGAGVRLALTPLVDGAIPLIPFYPFVAIASLWGGSLAGLTTAILGGLIADYLWLQPIGELGMSRQAVVSLAAFAVICGFVILFTGLLRALVELHVEAHERATLLAHELRHRANNLFGVVQAISTQTARNAVDVSDYKTRFGARLSALARAQQAVSDNADAPPELRQLLLYVLEPFSIERFTLQGPSVLVPRYLGSSCALLFHELGTNALKYGALSVPEGSVSIAWEFEAGRVRLDWREFNGPPVAWPSRTGFGYKLLQTAFPPEYGEAAIEFDLHGVHCTIRFTLD